MCKNKRAIFIMINSSQNSFYMRVFHWSRPVSNYVFFESRDQSLHGLLQSVVVSRIDSKSW